MLVTAVVVVGGGGKGEGGGGGAVVALAGADGVCKNNMRTTTRLITACMCTYKHSCTYLGSHTLQLLLVGRSWRQPRIKQACSMMPRLWRFHFFETASVNGAARHHAGQLQALQANRAFSLDLEYGATALVHRYSYTDRYRHIYIYIHIYIDIYIYIGLGFF